MKHSHPLRWLQIGLFLTLWLAYVFVHQVRFDGATPYSRLALLHSLYMEHTVVIDSYHERTSDKALYKGHYYSDKAPGTVVLCLPAFFASALLANTMKIDVDSPEGWLMTSWLSCAFSIALVTALGGVACYRWLAHWAGHTTALMATLALYLGAAPYPYATMMFSHAFVIGLISIALWAIDRDEFSSTEPRRRSDWMAGFALGFALASEFTAGLVIVGVGIYWISRRGWRRVACGFLAAIPPLLLIPFYNYLCFGDPWTLGYAHQATFPQMKQGLFGIQGPNLVIAYKMLFPPSRGLFFWTPFLLLSVLGYAALYKPGKAIFRLALSVPILQVLVISGYVWDWPAGWVLGPRYLAPMLPILILPAALAAGRYSYIGIYLAGLSILLTGLATHINAAPPAEPEILNPLLEMYLPALEQGVCSYNLIKLIGMGGHASMLFFLTWVLFLIYNLHSMASEMDTDKEKQIPA